MKLIFIAFVVSMFSADAEMHISEHLNLAIKNGCLKCVKDLVDQGAGVNGTGLEIAPLKLAASTYNYLNNSYDIMAYLIENKADVNVEDSYTEFYTPLNLCVYYGQLKCVELLVEHGANVNLSGYKTPLMNAANQDQTDILEYLLKKKADVNAVNEDKETALFLAVKKSSFESVKLLVEYGANVNARDEFKNTPLMAATASNRTDIMKVLIQHGADVNALSNGNETALTLAIRLENRDAGTLLVNNGAKRNVESPKEVNTQAFSEQSNEAKPLNCKCTCNGV